MKKMLAVCLGFALVLGVSPAWAGAQDKDKPKEEKKDKKDKKKDQGNEDLPVPDPKESEKQLNRLARELQNALEGPSPRQFLSFIDSAKFDDYPRFEDMMERLMREDSIRAHFRQAFNAPPSGQGKAQMAIDAEMELARKDGVGQISRRRQQLVIDWEYTRRGWRIINITPRNYFQPL